LRKRLRRHEADSGLRPDLPTSQEREEIRRLRQENFELGRANEILKAASVCFANLLHRARPFVTPTSREIPRARLSRRTDST
jgi:transposase